MNCDKIKDMLNAYIDGELAENERSEVEVHIKSCAKCHAEYNEYRNIAEILKSLPDEEPPKGYCGRLHKKLLDSKVRKFPFKRWVKYGSIAAAIVFVVGSVYFAGNNINMGNQNKSENSTSLNDNMMQMPETANYDMTAGSPAPPAQAPDMVQKDKVTTENAVADDFKQAEVETGGSGKARSRSAFNDSSREAKIIKSGNVTVQTENFDEFVSGITSVVQGYEGYIEENNIQVINISQDKNLRYGYMRIRVPKECFDDAIAYIEENSSISSKNLFETDVTKNYYDIDNQITNLLIQENNLRALLAKSETVADSLQIENELRRIRTEIDGLTLNLNDIDDRASMSSISLDVEEVTKISISVPESSGLWQRAAEGFVKTVNIIFELLQNIAVGIIALSPVILIAAVAAVIYIMYRKKRNR